MTESTFDQRTGADETPAPDSPPAIVPEPGFNYYVHLANGDVVTTVDVPSGNRWTGSLPDGSSLDLLIIGVYPR